MIARDGQTSGGVGAAERLRWSGRTDRGKIRPNNEDAFTGLQFDSREVHHLGKHGEASIRAHDFVFAVSDGIGGAVAGEYASRIAVEKITTLVPRAFRKSGDGREAGYTSVIAKTFDQIHRALTYLGWSYDECRGMETTLSVCWFTPGWMYFGHIGDSRIYHLPARASVIQQLSEDDTHVGWLVRTGKITEPEARRHPRRKVLQKALGGGHQFVKPQMGVVACQPGDIFLLCTDGLVESLYDSNLVEHLRSPRLPKGGYDPAHQLVQDSLEKYSRDNITALVVELM
jgi:protein phosphatase